MQGRALSVGFQWVWLGQKCRPMHAHSCVQTCTSIPTINHHLLIWQVQIHIHVEEKRFSKQTSTMQTALCTAEAAFPIISQSSTGSSWFFPPCSDET